MISDKRSEEVVSLNLTLILQVISFLILMFILTKVFYHPLLNFLDRRAQYVREEIEKAERERTKAEEKFKQAEENLEKTQKQVLEWKDFAQKEIEENRKAFLQRAKEEKEQILAQAKEEFTREIVKARGELKKEVATISLAIAEKILRREINEKDKAKLIRDGIENLKMSNCSN